MEKIPAIQLREQLQCYGRTRWDSAEHILHFNWSADTVELIFCGTQLIAAFRADCGYEIEGMPNDPNAPRRENWPCIGIFIDDATVPARRYHITHANEALLLFQSDKPETHRIRITKLTENYKTFLALVSFTAVGEILPTKRKIRKRIEIVGDSITCGYGNLVNEPTRHYFAPDEDAWVAYGPLAARKLNLELSCVSVSGITAVKHEGWGIPIYMQGLYPYTDKPWQEKAGEQPEAWDFKKNHNDYVVVNLGTNDCFGILFSPDASELDNFVNAYAAFISDIRRLNGADTHIICALGTMNYYLYSDIEKAVAKLQAETGDKRLHTLRFKPIHPFDGLGADGHPSAATHQKMAAELVDFIKTLD